MANDDGTEQPKIFNLSSPKHTQDLAVRPFLPEDEACALVRPETRSFSVAVWADQLSPKTSWRRKRTTPHPERVACGVTVDPLGEAVISTRSDLSREEGQRRQPAATHAVP